MKRMAFLVLAGLIVVGLWMGTASARNSQEESGTGVGPGRGQRQGRGASKGFAGRGQGQGQDKGQGRGKSSTLDVVNATCPIMNNKLPTGGATVDFIRRYKGKKIGFCSAGCSAKWDRLLGKDKDAKLLAAFLGQTRTSASEKGAKGQGKSQGRGEGQGQGRGKSSTVAVVNATCPIMNNKLPAAGAAADLVREYKGKKIGFCCAGCPEKWDALSAKDKDAKLLAAFLRQTSAPAPKRDGKGPAAGKGKGQGQGGGQGRGQGRGRGDGRGLGRRQGRGPRDGRGQGRGQGQGRGNGGCETTGE